MTVPTRPTLVLLAADAGRLRQPDAAGVPRLYGPRARRAAACPGRRTAGLLAGPDRADRRAGRPHRQGASRPASCDLAGARLDAARAGLRRPALCRDPAPWRRQRARRSRPTSSISPTPGACRWSRPTSPISPKPDDYEAHDALLAIADGRLVSRPERRRRDAGARLQDARRDGGALRATCRRPPPTPSRSRCAAPIGRAPASRSCRASPPATDEDPRRSSPRRRPSCAARPRRG